MHERLGLGLDNTYGLGLGLEIEIVKRMCVLRAEGLGLGKVMHEGLELEKG